MWSGFVNRRSGVQSPQPAPWRSSPSAGCGRATFSADPSYGLGRHQAATNLTVQMLDLIGPADPIARSSWLISFREFAAIVTKG